MPESVTDRPTKAHEQVFLLAKAPRYFYDAEAVREPMVTGSNGSTFTKGKTFAAAQALSSVGQRERTDNPAGRNLRSVWTIATRPSRVSHFAVMAPALAERCIKAGTSEHGCCSACGAPWVRVVERAKVPDRPGRVQGRGEDRPAAAHDQDGRSGNRHSLATATTGWRPSCDCSREVVPCRVLDPFGGSGTTAAVAEVLGREGTICEPNESYRALVPARAAEVRASMERRAAKRKAPAAPPGQLGLWGSP